LELHPVDIVISVINIAVLFILLRLILWKYVINFLSKRAEKVRSDMANAAKSREEAQALQNEYKEKLGELKIQGADIVRASQQKATEESDRILCDAKNKADELMSDAHARIESEKKQALEDAHESITELAAEMAARILEREVKASDNTHTVKEFFNK